MTGTEDATARGASAPGEDEWVSGEDVREDAGAARADSQPEPVADTGTDEWDASDQQQTEDQVADPLAPDRIEPQDVDRSDGDGEGHSPFDEDEASSREANSSGNDE